MAIPERVSVLLYGKIEVDLDQLRCYNRDMIYFVRSVNRHIKIGYSNDPEYRVKSLQTGCPTKLHIQAIMDGNSQTELGLHELFAHLRVRGEWFRYTEELKWFIRSVKANPGRNNIKTLYMESQKMRITAKAKRTKSNKLYNKICEV